MFLVHLPYFLSDLLAVRSFTASTLQVSPNTSMVQTSGVGPQWPEGFLRLRRRSQDFCRDHSPRSRAFWLWPLDLQAGPKNSINRFNGLFVPKKKLLYGCLHYATGRSHSFNSRTGQWVKQALSNALPHRSVQRSGRPALTEASPN